MPQKHSVDVDRDASGIDEPDPIGRQADAVDDRSGVSRRTLLGWTALAGGLAWGATQAAAAAAPASTTGATPAAGSTAPAAGSSFVPGLAPFPQQGDLNFQTLTAYGEAGYGAGEVGEVSAAVELVQAAITAGGANALPAYQPYVATFEALGAQLASAAAAEQAAGRLTSARAKYLRSASYYNCALFFILGTSSASREGQLYASMQASWAAAAALLDPVYVRVEVPALIRFPDSTAPGGVTERAVNIPAYFVRAPGPGRKPTVIVNNGSDAQFIDVYAFGAAAAVERGYNALIFEGPGQGSLLFEQDIPFTPYWQDVVTPLVDFLIEQPEVDASKLGLTGWSFGGLLVLRAAAFEHRLAAVVGDPGYINNSAPWQELVEALDQNFGAVTNANWLELYEGSPTFGVQGQLALRFLVGKRGEIYDPAYRAASLKGQVNPDIVGLLDRVASFSADGALLAQIRAHVLINDYQGDQFVGSSQSAPLYNALTGAASREIFRFTAAQGAEYHCAPMAPQFRNEVVYDWMDEIFGHHQQRPIPPTPPVDPHPPVSHIVPPLANTGPPLATTGAVGGGLVAVGAATTTAGRRRRSTPPTVTPPRSTAPPAAPPTALSTAPPTAAASPTAEPTDHPTDDPTAGP